MQRSVDVKFGVPLSSVKDNATHFSHSYQFAVNLPANNNYTPISIKGTASSTLNLDCLCLFLDEYCGKGRCIYRKRRRRLL